MFDLKKALSLPDIHRIVAKRDGVIERFGPLFRDPESLSQQDYLDFLSFQHNHHWTGLERLGRAAADDMDILRGAIASLVDQSEPLPERLDASLALLNGVGVATLTPMLLLAYPDSYGVWNGTSQEEMTKRGIWPAFARGSSEGKKYQAINSVLLELAKDEGVDLWTLDALWWQSNLERKGSGRIKGAEFKAAWQMADQAERTAKQSNGQTVEKTVKNKELRLSKEALIKILEDQLKENGCRCAITGLDLDLEGSDSQLSPSLDRIDSDGHYEHGNLQVVARFINFWKRDTLDAEFRRLIALVRHQGEASSALGA